MSPNAIDIILEALAIVLYFGVLISFAAYTYKRQVSDTDFVLGSRSMNFFLTAMAVHASDMSSWLFMGYPATVYAFGVHQAWAGIGLLVFMFLNWQFIAPKLRIATEKYQSLTLSTFFEKRLSDTSGVIRIFTAIMLFIFYTIYISAALVAMGYILNTLFDINYIAGIFIGILIVVPYVFIGGYLTLAWVDLFQGLFLMCVVVFVPLFILPMVGGFEGIGAAIEQKQLTRFLFPDFSAITLWGTFFLAAGWGLGYFGQPHILTKFMGIKNVSEIGKAKMVGMTWMFIALTAATLVGLVGIPFFKTSLLEPTEVFLKMVQQTFPPFWIGLILCAVFAVSINAISAMVLVLASGLAEDIYKKVIHKRASHKELLLVSRLSVILVALISFAIAALKISTIYGLIFYAWSGLGASFGPLILLCLYMRKVNKYGAWCGILLGGGIAGIWPLIEPFFPIDTSPLPFAFCVSILAIWLISRLTSRKTSSA